MSATLDTRDLREAVAIEAARGLTAQPKTLPGWLFYDGEGDLPPENLYQLDLEFSRNRKRES